MLRNYIEQDPKLRIYEERFNVFNQLRELNELCDVTLIVGGKRLNLHRVVLSSGSPYFRKMFTLSMRETLLKEISIPDISYETMERVVEFLYTSTTKLTTENAQNILIASDYLEIHSLLDICGKYILKQIDANNCFTMRELLITTNCDPKTIASASEYINKNFSKISYNDSFLQLDVNNVVELLSSNDLCCLSEEDVCHGAIRWLQASRDRKRYSQQIFNCLRLSLLPDIFKSKYIDNNRLFNRGAANKNIGACDAKRTSKTSLMALGRNKDSLHIYDSMTKNWTKYMDIERKEYGCAAADGKYIFLSGRSDNRNYFIDFINLQTKKLTSLLSVPPEFNTYNIFKMTVVGCQLYLFKVKKDANNRQDKYKLHWAVYDLEKASWNYEFEPISTSFRPYYKAVGKFIYLFENSDEDTIVRKLDTATQKWQDVTLMTKQDCSHRIMTYKGKLYFAGRYSQLGVIRRDIWNVYDPATNKKKHLAFFDDSNACKIEATSDGIYALTDYGFLRTPSYEMDFYDVETDEWRFEGKIPDELAGSMFCAVPDIFCQQ